MPHSLDLLNKEGFGVCVCVCVCVCSEPQRGGSAEPGLAQEPVSKVNMVKRSSGENRFSSLTTDRRGKS